MINSSLPIQNNGEQKAGKCYIQNAGREGIVNQEFYYPANLSPKMKVKYRHFHMHKDW